MPKAVADAAGRRFELLLPFGCGGSSETETSLPMQWRYDEAEGTLRVSGKQMLWSKAEWKPDDRAPPGAAPGLWTTPPGAARGACHAAHQAASYHPPPPPPVPTLHHP